MNIFPINNLLSLSLCLFSASILIFVSAIIYKHSKLYWSNKDRKQLISTKKKLHYVGRFCIALFSSALVLFAISYYSNEYLFFDLFSPFLLIIGLSIFFWNLSFVVNIGENKTDFTEAVSKEADTVTIREIIGGEYFNKAVLMSTNFFAGENQTVAFHSVRIGVWSLISWIIPIIGTDLVLNNYDPIINGLIGNIDKNYIYVGLIVLTVGSITITTRLVKSLSADLDIVKRNLLSKSQENKKKFNLYQSYLLNLREHLNIRNSQSLKNTAEGYMRDLIKTYPKIRSASLFMKDQLDNDSLKIVASVGVFEEDTHLRLNWNAVEMQDRGLAGHVFYTEKSLVAKMRKFPEDKFFQCDHLSFRFQPNQNREKMEYKSLIGIPILRIENGTSSCIGVICFDSRDKKAFDDLKFKERLVDIANFLSIAMEINIINFSLLP